MTHHDISRHSFRRLRSEVRAAIAEQASHHLRLHTDGPLIARHLCTNSGFCRACVACHYLTEEQMKRAARRYQLGMSRDGGVIFWQTDQLGFIYDGKIMYYRSDCHRDHDHTPTWVSSELCRFYLNDEPELAWQIQSSHCLFGLHLLGHTANSSEEGTSQRDRVVCVVEAEKTAVILSEHFPQHLWLAAGGLNELTPTKLFPLRNHRVILFPDTDETCSAFTLWYRIAQEAMRQNGGKITVSPLLEQKATPAQKRAKIDLVDFIM